MSKKVIIDTEECIGCENCIEICRKVFRLNKDTEKAEAILPEGVDEECIKEAISSCPLECIFLEE